MPWLHAVVDVPAHDHEATAAFWSRLTGWSLGPAWPGHPELRSFEPPSGRSYLHLQEIDGPARVHLDVEADEPAALVERAVGLGAVRVGASDRWQTLRSPGGLPFCVLAAGDRTTPGPVAWPDGHRGRVVQVCIDSPPARQDREVAFWRELLGGRWVDSPAPEFAGKWHDDAGSPLQLLFQRLDEEDGDVRAHLDHGTDEVPLEVARLRGLGASDVGPGRGWHVLRDPRGMVFCVTGNSPATTRTRELG